MSTSEVVTDAAGVRDCSCSCSSGFSQEKNVPPATSSSVTVVKVIETPVRTKKAAVKNDTLAPEVTETPADTTDAGETDEFVAYDTDDLMLDMDEDVKPVVKTKGIANRRVRVISNSDVTGTEPDFES